MGGSAPSPETQIAQAVAQAEAAVGRAMQDDRIDRAQLTAVLEQFAQQANNGGERYELLFRRLRELIADLEAAPPAPEISIDDRAAQAIADAQQAADAALADPNADRAALTTELMEAAEYYADGEANGSPWLAVAQRYRELAAQLGGAV